MATYLLHIDEPRLHPDKTGTKLLENCLQPGEARGLAVPNDGTPLFRIVYVL